MDLGKESKIKLDLLSKIITIVCTIIGFPVVLGLPWIVLGLSSTYCVLYGVFVGALLVWLHYTRSSKYDVVRMIIYGLILMALWSALLEKLNIIYGFKKDTWNYLQEDK